MRVVGVLFLVLAQPVVAAENYDSVAFARFAYADSSAFHHSLEQRSRDTRTSIEKRLPRLPLAMLRDARSAVPPPPGAPLPIAKPANVEAAKPKTRIALAKVEPEKPPPPLRIATPDSEPVAVPPVATSEPIAPEPPPAAQRLAALPQPMHLLPQADGLEPIDTVAPPPVTERRKQAAPKRSKPHTRATAHAPTSSHRPAPKAEPDPSPSKIPRWAQQMYDSNWQHHLFSYQR